MKTSRLRSVGVLVALLFLFTGGLQSVYGYDGCSLLRDTVPFPAKQAPPLTLKSERRTRFAFRR
jgi:hypothetical protein